VWTTETDGDVQLHWAVDREALQTEMRRMALLLVTNDFSLTPVQMLTLYRQKTAWRSASASANPICWSHPFSAQDDRIQGMLLVNMLALLTTACSNANSAKKA